jgi:thiamine-phosphate pyrophosphorylase
MSRLRGLYAITPDRPHRDRPLTEPVSRALNGGARIIQYRDKGIDRDRRLAEARDLSALCRDAGALLIVNDDLDIAAESGADGVHLGRDDQDPQTARARLGPKAVIGISCYNDFERAKEAAEIGADYVAFGRFFPSETKPHAVQADPELLRRARRELELPLVAIGGITPENGGLLIAAGADMLAVIHGVFSATDIRAAAHSFARLFTTQNDTSNQNDTSKETRAHDQIPRPV